jgi:UDP-N-acetylglucosamine 2-epimerase (non-hydrolysing)
MENMPLKIVNVVGARPNFMKIAPLIKEYAKHGDAIKVTLLHTGQHYDDAMSRVFFSDLGIPQPDIDLGVGSASHAVQTAKVMIGFEEQLLKLRPNLVVVVGDVNSTMACTIVAAKLNIRVAHVEAGLRSFDRTMPEEINRIVTDSLADLLFTTTEDANLNLTREGVAADRMFFVGNTMIDSLLSLRPRFESGGTKAKFGLNNEPFAFFTLHRPSNVDDRSTLTGICSAIGSIQQRIKIFWPLHPRTRNRLAEHNLMEVVTQMKNLIIADPLSYIDSMSVMAAASMVLTDSGGIQEETTILGIPCLTLRNNTERPVTITEGTNQLVGSAPERIVESAMEILRTGGKKGRTPKLWDGNAAERIVQVILEQFPLTGD